MPGQVFLLLLCLPPWIAGIFQMVDEGKIAVTPAAGRRMKKIP